MSLSRLLSKPLLTLIFLSVQSLNLAGGSEINLTTEFLLKLAPPPSDKALSEIPDLGRKLLALRSYFRAGSKLIERWSWTEKEIRAFQGSTKQQALLREVALVSVHFAKANPGFEIYANTKVRSLDVQIKNWNSNESVRAAAAELLAAWNQKFGIDDWSDSAANSKVVRNWLSSFGLTNRARLAAPGLTLHGQANAIDFQVMRNGKIIAGADSRQIKNVWRNQKWDAKLKESIAAVGPSFSGPLTSPDEPWHYRYEPTLDIETDDNSEGHARKIQSR